MKAGDIIRLKWQTERYFLCDLRLIPYPYRLNEPGVFDAWWKGRQN